MTWCIQVIEAWNGMGMGLQVRWWQRKENGQKEREKEQLSKLHGLRNSWGKPGRAPRRLTSDVLWRSWHMRYVSGLSLDCWQILEGGHQGTSCGMSTTVCYNGGPAPWDNGGLWHTQKFTECWREKLLVGSGLFGPEIIIQKRCYINHCLAH